MSSNRSSDRIYFLDSMRAILMMLGVILHSAQVFNPKHGWIIYSPETIPFAEVLVSTIHLFRMPAFFIVSGYFAVFTLQKYNVEKFLKVRILRILIPLVLTALTLNSLQTYILVETGWMDFEFISYIQKGGWVSHLWFLINLIIYFLVFAVGYKILKPIYKKIYLYIYRLYMYTNIYTILFVMTMMTIFLLTIVSIIAKNWQYEEIINLNSLVYYITFFAFGIFIYLNKEMQNKFIQMSPFLSIFVVSISVFLNHYFSDFEGKIYKVLYFFFGITAKYYISSLCFYLFYKYTDKKIKIFQFLSDASYSVYLFHHVLVIGIGIVLIDLNINKYISLILLISIVAFVSMAIHYFFISRNNILSILFNGKVNKKTV